MGKLMKKIVIIGLLACLATSGFSKSNVFDDFEPKFTTLNGNIFMVAQMPELRASLHNGNRLQFVFRGNESKILYHIETSNAHLVTDQNFDLLALVPEEVARSLMHKNLKKIIIHLPEGKQVIKFKKGEVRVSRAN